MNEIDEAMILKEEKHIRNAWVAGAISAAITFIVSMIGAYSETVRHKHGFDTWTLLDVALIAGLTYGIYRKNRFCALGMLIYFVLSKFMIAASTGKFTGGVMALLFGYYFFQGTRAAFRLHKLKPKEDLPDKKKRSWGFLVGMTTLSIVMILVVAFFVVAAIGPGTEVVPGKMLNKKYSSFIRGICERI